MLKTLFTLLNVVLLSACLVMGETAATISGKISDENKHEYALCSIDLFIKDGESLTPLGHMKRQITFNGLMFEQLFIIRPDKHRFIVEINCNDSAQIYRSGPLDLANGLNNPVDLGHIVLKRKN